MQTLPVQSSEHPAELSPRWSAWFISPGLFIPPLSSSLAQGSVYAARIPAPC